MAKVIVEIDTRTGDITFEVDGVAGSKCKDITSVLTQGMNIVSEKEKEDLYAQQELPEYIGDM